MKIRSVGAELFVVPYGRKDTDQHDDAYSRLSQFCDRHWKLNNTYATCIC